MGIAMITQVFHSHNSIRNVPCGSSNSGLWLFVGILTAGTLRILVRKPKLMQWQANRKIHYQTMLHERHCFELTQQTGALCRTLPICVLPFELHSSVRQEFSSCALSLPKSSANMSTRLSMP